MITEISEQIEVDAVFSNGQLNPVSFVWNKRLYRVKKVHGRYQDFVGRTQRLHYAVGTGAGEVFEISFNTEDMTWELLRIHNKS